MNCYDMGKFKSILILAGAVFFFVPLGCQREEMLDSTNTQPRDSAFVEYSIIADRESDFLDPDHSSDVTTKTVIQSDGQVLWSVRECISLFVGSNNAGGYKMTSENDKPEASTVFTGEIPATPETNTFWAVYPYRESTTFDGEEIVVELPYEQVAKKESFCDDLFISVAKSDSQHFYFRNVCGGIQFTVSTPGIRQVTLRSVGDCVLAGKLHIRFDEEGIPYVFSVDAGNTSVSVTAPDGEEFEVGTPYYIVAIPTEQSYFSLIYRTNSDYAEYQTSSSNSIKRSVFAKLLGKDTGLDFNESKATFDFWGSSSWLPRTPEEREHVKAVLFHARSSRSMPMGLISTQNEYMYSEVRDDTLHIYTGANYFEALNGEGLFSAFPKMEIIDISAVNTSQIKSMARMFSGANNLKTLNISSFNTSNVTSMAGMFSDCYSLESIDLTGFDTSNTEDFSEMFRYCYRLKELNLPFDFSKARTIRNMCECCWNLKKIRLSITSSPVLDNVFGAFSECFRCNIIDLGGLDVSSCSDVQGLFALLAFKSRNCLVISTEDTKNRILDEDDTFNHELVSWILPGEEIPTVEDKLFSDLYYSTNYEMDGVIEQVQSSTVSNGIDLYFFGDAYSDRLIENGKYRSDLMLAIDAIFSEEPFKTFRSYFNIYIVYIVSANEVIGVDPYDTAFSTTVHPSTTGIGRVLSPYEYLTYYKRQFINEEVISVTVVNHDSGHGTAYLNWDHDPEIDYGYGNGEAYVTRCSNDEQFKNTVLHEFGHAFAKLADEYWYDDGVVPTQADIDCLEDFQRYGVYKNVSTSNDPDSAPWSRFLKDERYVSNGLGLYEGGYTYASKIWRPTENSIMRYNTGGYNAPSRAAIYNKIHKRVYGKSWEFDYDEFTEYDHINLENKMSVSLRQTIRTDSQLKHVPPVLIRQEAK